MEEIKPVFRSSDMSPENKEKFIQAVIQVFQNTSFDSDYNLNS